MTKILFQENHIHSNYSDGRQSLRDIFEYNDLHDKFDLVISDHVDKHTKWFNKYCQNIKKMRLEYKNFSVKIGCEVKIIDKSGELNTTKNILDSAEIIIGSVHHFKNIKLLEMEELIKEEYELTKILANNKKIDILGHPFSMAKRFFNANPPLAYIREIYNLCKKNKIKFEYSQKHASENIKKFVQEKIKQGEINNFSFGSDAHDVSEIGNSAFSLAPEINVLITGAGAGVGQSIIKSIKLSKLKTKIVAVDSSHLAAGLYRADKAYLVPLRYEKNYIGKIIDVCRKEKIQIIFPGTDIELEILSLNKAKIETKTSTKLIVSNVKTVRIADDKWKMVQFFKKNGLAYPQSWLAKDVKKALGEIKFPAIVKPRVGARSVGVCKVFNEDELKQKVKDTENALIQEFLPGDNNEYTCGAFFYQGRCYGVICARRWLRNGDTYKAIFLKDASLEKFIIKVGKKLDINGPCNFQLRKTKKGPVIFEINCRFSGTTGSRSALGFNVANVLMQKLFFKRPLKNLTFKESYMFRYWNETFVELKEVKKLKSKKFIGGISSKTNIF